MVYIETYLCIEMAYSKSKKVQEKFTKQVEANHKTLQAGNSTKSGPTKH